jgi:hypothetical protein
MHGTTMTENDRLDAGVARPSPHFPLADFGTNVGVSAKRKLSISPLFGTRAIVIRRADAGVSTIQ